MTQSLDVLVVGAGAAGLAAMDGLREAGVPSVALEARARVGGRAYTAYDLAPHPVELGAEFIHGENVSTWNLLRRFGFGAVDLLPHMNAQGFVNGVRLDQPTFLSNPNSLLLFRMQGAAKQWLAEGHSDAAVADVAREWTGFFAGQPTASELKLWANAASELAAADLDQLGVAGLLEPTFTGDGTNLYFRVREGYSRLLERFADGLDVRIGTPVTRIAWNREGVVAQTTAGEEVAARRVIITLPLALLQQNAVVFDPPLPAAKREAIGSVGAGKIGKVVMRFDEPFWPDDLTFLFTTHDSQLLWRPGRGRDDEAPILTAYFGGRAVDRFAALGEAAVAEAVQHLEEIFSVRVADRLVEARFVNWAADPWARMGYSYLPPGATGMIARIAQPVDDVLFFAGEATNVERPHCVHGALDSGWRAAQEAIASLR
jgi:monoamine oxidase